MAEPATPVMAVKVEMPEKPDTAPAVELQTVAEAEQPVMVVPVVVLTQEEIHLAHPVVVGITEADHRAEPTAAPEELPVTAVAARTAATPPAAAAAAQVLPEEPVSN